jgi:hypothetical protein
MTRSSASKGLSANKVLVCIRHKHVCTLQITGLPPNREQSLARYLNCAL